MLLHREGYVKGLLGLHNSNATDLGFDDRGSAFGRDTISDSVAQPARQGIQ
jgi:hypothetical protein